MAGLHFEFVSPENVLFSGDVDQVDLPGIEGDLGVLPGHAPMVTTLRPGVPGLSDVFGRKAVAIVGFAGAAASLWMFAHTGANPALLFVGLFVVSFFCLGNVALITGPIATEAAPSPGGGVWLISSSDVIVCGLTRTTTVACAA